MNTFASSNLLGVECPILDFRILQPNDEYLIGTCFSATDPDELNAFEMPIFNCEDALLRSIELLEREVLS